MGDIAKDINSKFSSEKVKAIINIRYTAHWLETMGSAILKPYQISEQQYNVLRILKGANEAVKVTVVRERMIQKSPNITRLMDKMCQKKLIERMRCEEDRRVVYVKISNKGLKLLEQINMGELEHKVNDLTEADFKQLNTLLDKLR